MSTQSTGGDWQGPSDGLDMAPSVEKTTYESGSRSSLYRVPGSRSLETAHAPKEVGDDPKSKSGATAGKTGASREDKIAIRRLLALARNHACNLVEVCEVSDPVEMVIVGKDLLSSLERVWKYRHVYEDDWQEIVNSIQLALHGFQFESMTLPQAQCLSFVITNVVSVGESSASATTDVRVRLRKVGLDPWSMFSGRVDD